MKLKRIFLIAGLGLLTLTGCSAENGGVSSTEKLNNSISLNVKQADLIADITDNEKYLNKDYLYEIDGLDNEDTINIIITLSKEGLADSFNSNSSRYSSLGDYANSNYASSKIREMKNEQTKFAKELLENDYINEVNHSYTTLFNGFSATTTYGQLKKLERANLGVGVIISEVYAESEHSSTSSSSYDAVTNFVNVYGTGIFDSSGIGYDGTNTSVAILDSGFDIHHTVFQNMPNEESIMITKSEVDEVLKDTKAYGYHEDIKVQDVYMNSKIPFVYDYADKDPDVAPYDSNHGTHVAGIIGGKDEVITGVATNTQLVLMKVFGDINNGAIQDDILAALEDAMLLGVDAINLSLGTACGFARSDDDLRINEVYDKIEASGISLIVAASNDYSSGYGGEYSNTNKASNPDSATVGSPGTYTSTISVASISGEKSKYMVGEDGRPFFFNNANNSAGEAYDFYDMLFDKLGVKADQLEIEYVTVPGVGKKVNYSNVDVEGKVALVKRGDISFEEKAQVALSQGAIGCIIYNNIAGEVYMNAGNKLELALCSISKDDGERLAKSSTGILTLDKSYLAGPFMSDFSSWGPVSNLSLKPEITAHGGSILSSVPGGGYEKISGTSMACPNLCGVVILVRQALKERYPELENDAVTLATMTNQLLMSTGTIIFAEEGNPYSPRKQGAGLGDLQKAVDTLAYLTVEDNPNTFADESKKSKIELYDDPKQKGVYELEFNVVNTSDETLKYNLTDYTMTESLSTSDPEYVAEKAYMLNPTTKAEILNAGGNLDGTVLTVNPNSTVKVKYTITLSKADKKYLEKSFINGMFVEGFAILESLNEDKIDLSIPFLAFYGDWTVAPMFDKTFYEVESEKYNGAIDQEDKLKADYYATTPLGTYYYSYIIPLGSFVYEIDENKYDKIPASEEHAAMGYNLETINGITTVYAGLLRNAKKMTSTIVNADTGEVVWSHEKYDEHKAYFSGSIIPGYDLINITAAELGLQNNTKYTFKMVAELDYDDGGLSDNLNNTFEFSFYIDYEAPIIKDAQFYTKYDKSLEENRYFVDVYVYDNHYAQSIRPFTIVNGKLTSLSDNVIPIYGEKGTINKVTVEITDYMDLLQYGVLEDGTFAISNGLGFLVDDYALNQSYSFVTLPGTNTSNITYTEGKDINKKATGQYTYRKKLNAGDILDLTKMLNSDDPTLALVEDTDVKSRYFASLSWKSSNEDVIKVKNGVIEVQKVEADTKVTITASTMNTDGYAYSVSLEIPVRGTTEEVKSEKQKLTDIEFTYFDVLKAFIDGPEMSEIGKTGDRIFFTEKSVISCYPSEKVKLGYELEPWNLKNYELIWSSTNESVATVDEEGVVTALKEGNATITLKVKVDGKTSTLMASAKVEVKSEFVIEGTTLIAYKGLGGDVVIPNDEGILYIGPFAFSLYTTDYEIKIENDDYDAAKDPGTNDSITSVVIPAEVKEIQKYAFYNCTSLEKVTLLKNSEGDSVPFIKEYAFAGDKKLKEINLEEVDLIGKCAFENCTSLTKADITKVYAIGEGAFKNCTNLEYVDITQLRNAAPLVFENCTSLKTISNGRYTNFSEGMFKNTGLTTLTYYADRIPNNCFANCKDLETVTVANTVVYVGSEAFGNCQKLKEVEFLDGAGTEFIYERAFVDCNTLESITLPDSTFVVEANAFESCSKLQNVVFNKNTNISNNLGSIFASCDELATFKVNSENKYYSSSNNLLLSSDGKTLVLAAPKYDYKNYTIKAGIENIAEGAFASISSLENLTITSDVKNIARYAFKNCANLVSVTLPTSEILIKDGAFEKCAKLATVENMESLTYFAPYVFAETALSNVTVNNAVIEEAAFKEINTLESVSIGANTKIGKYAFADNKKLTSLVVEADEIGSYAFTNCTNLKELNLENVKVINEGAFKGCSLISTLSLPNIEIIGSYAFADNKKLATIDMASVIEIGSYAFASTEKNTSNLLTNIALSNVEVIGEYAFSKSENLKVVSLGNDVVNLGSYAFTLCPLLKEVTFEFADTSNNTISECVFAEASSLTTVNVEGIKEIAGGAFMNCLALTTIDLSKVEKIGEQAFYGCSSLVEADLSSVKVIGDGAFLSASKLAKVTLKVVEEIGFQSLSCINVEEIKLPNTIKKIDTAAFYYNQKQTKFTDLNGKDTVKINDYVILDEGVLYTVFENGKYLLSSYPTAKTAATYEVLFGTVRVEEYAGYFNKKIEKIVFPSTLKLIGNMCFYGSVLLDTIEFRSTEAPVFEGTVSLDIEYAKDTEAYKLINKYFQFNGYFPLYYGQFNDMVGTLKEKIKIIIPENEDCTGYDNVLYDLYFDLDKMEKSTYTALNSKSLDYLNKVLLVPNYQEVKLEHEDLILNAKTAYNLLNQKLVSTEGEVDPDYLAELKEFGYTEEELNKLYSNLVKAEEKWLELKMARINKVYAHLIEDIKNLGSEYSLDKISDYYNVIETLESMDRNDKKYIDQTNVDSFKEGFDEYFKNLNEDVETITNVSTLPTSTVTKVGLAVAATITGVTAMLSIVGALFKKHMLF